MSQLPIVIRRCLEQYQRRDERERSAVTLRESEQRFHALSESVASGILNPQFVNAAASKYKLMALWERWKADWAQVGYG